MEALGVRWIALVSAFALGCGARSQLITPDVGFVDHGLDAADATHRDTGMDAPSFLPPVDTSCPGVCPYRNLAASFPPFHPLAPPDVPIDCSNGFEIGGANGSCGHATYTLQSTRPGGARAITLDVDFATYLVPDGVTITGIDATGARYTLFQSCRLQTSLVGGPSNHRPTDDTIRQFHLDVREGTSRLDVDFGAVTSPMYIQVLGLCDFHVTRYTAATWWQAVP